MCYYVAPSHPPQFPCLTSSPLIPPTQSKGRWSIPPAWFDQYPSSPIPLSGILVGDPWTVPAIDTAGALVNAWVRGLISDEAMVGVLVREWDL